MTRTTAALSVPFTNAFALPVVAYTFFGRYVDGATEGATVAFDLATAASLVSSSSPWPFDAAFPEVTEPEFVTALTTFNADVLDKVFRQQIAGGMVSAPGTDSALVNFSGATDGGDVTSVHVVPAPSAFTLLGLGLAGTRRRR
ncbi:MAG: PEP-CTERM sorting domain-containing protein [Planctomycetes bacterium]|nr:PEP-CTERM sorting domain-containing protein [Planctomycetota bacterium]